MVLIRRARRMWWALAFAGQCQDALDELIFLNPPTVSGIDEIPTLRELAGTWQPARHVRELRPSNALRCNQANYHTWSMISCSTRHAICWPSGTIVSERRRDSSYYDLLASEARLCCFVAIAQGQLPQESWFALGRLLTTAGGEPILLSWSGSMFEYLMPLLVMPTYEHTLLDQTYKAAVDRQIEYGKTARSTVGHFGIRL